MDKFKISKISVWVATIAMPVIALAAPQQPGSQITNLSQVESLLGAILGWLTTFLYIAAAIMIIIAAFKYLTAQGDEEAVGKAKNMLIYAVIAIALGLLAGGVSSLVQNILGQSGTPNVGPN